MLKVNNLNIVYQKFLGNVSYNVRNNSLKFEQDCSKNEGGDRFLVIPRYSCSTLCLPSETCYAARLWPVISQKIIGIFFNGKK